MQVSIVTECHCDCNGESIVWYKNARLKLKSRWMTLQIPRFKLLQMNTLRIYSVSILIGQCIWRLFPQFTRSIVFHLYAITAAAHKNKTKYKTNVRCKINQSTSELPQLSIIYFIVYYYRTIYMPFDHLFWIESLCCIQDSETMDKVKNAFDV